MQELRFAVTLFISDTKNTDPEDASVVYWSEILATYPEVPVLITSATRFSEK
jgi:hypothetical protein